MLEVWPLFTLVLPSVDSCPLARVLSFVCLRVLSRASVRASGRFYEVCYLYFLYIPFSKRHGKGNCPTTHVTQRPRQAAFAQQHGDDKTGGRGPPTTCSSTSSISLGEVRTGVQGYIQAEVHVRVRLPCRERGSRGRGSMCPAAQGRVAEPPSHSTEQTALPVSLARIGSSGRGGHSSRVSPRRASALQ